MKRNKYFIAGLSVFIVIFLAGISSVPASTRYNQKGLTKWVLGKAYEGYMICEMFNRTCLVDMNGNIVHMWDGGGQEMLPPELTNGKKGHVLVAVGRKMQERDWNGSIMLPN